MRILVATSHRGLWGGVEKYLQSAIPGLIQHGHSVALLYEYALNANEEGIDSRAGRVPSWCSTELGVDSALQSIKSWAPDAVYSHGLDDNQLERRLLDTYPSALYAHTYYGTCISGRKCHSWPRLQPCGRRFGAACLMLYYPRRCGGTNPRTMWQLYQLQSKRVSILPDYQAVLVASQHMYHEYQQHAVSPDRLHLVPLPIDEGDAGAPVHRPSAQRDRILYVGRLINVKGVSHLLRAVPLAARKLGRSLSLTIAGDGPDRAKIEELARQLGLTVKFAGWVDSEQRSHLMRETDLVAVPSLWPEPFGMVGVEAGRFGVPAVGFAVGGIPDWLIPGRTGELAPGDPATVDGLAEAMVRALADPQHYQKLCAGAWEMAKQFSLARHVEGVERIISAGLAASTGTPGRHIPTIV